MQQEGEEEFVTIDPVLCSWLWCLYRGLSQEIDPGTGRQMNTPDEQQIIISGVGGQGDFVYYPFTG